MSFAKIFETENGQVLVMRDTDEDNDNPVLKVYAEPEGMGVCCMVMTAPDTLAGVTRRDEDFEGMTAERAALIAAHLFSAAGVFTA